MSILAAAGDQSVISPTLTVILQLLNIPFVGIVIVALVKGLLVTGREHQRVVSALAAATEERIAAQSALIDRVMPAMQDVVLVLTMASKLIERIEWTTRGEPPPPPPRVPRRGH